MMLIAFSVSLVILFYWQYTLNKQEKDFGPLFKETKSKKNS